MKKIFRKFLCVAAALLMAVSFAGCNRDGGGVDVPFEGDGSGGNLSLALTTGGFGKKWLVDLATAFGNAYNVKCNVMPYATKELNSLIASGQCKHDVVVAPDYATGLAAGGKLTELTDVYNSVPDGEEKTIAEKMNQRVREYVQTEDGKYYEMQHFNTVCSLIYNKGVLDRLFPDGWQIPRTSDELLALARRIRNEHSECNCLKNNNGGCAYAFSMSTGIDYYAAYLGLPWWAQYASPEGYYEYYRCRYQDNSGNWLLAENAESQQQPGREKALAILNEMLYAGNGYVHADAASMSFTDAQSAFASNGYGDNPRQCAFIVSGNWMENELRNDLMRNPQDIRMMKVPVISDIVETLENKNMTDAELSAVVDAVDAGKDYAAAKESVASLSKKDFDRIAEARACMYSANFNLPIVVPSTSRNVDNAKKFLRFMASDAGQEICAAALNGLTMTYGYEVDTTRYTSTFLKSQIEAFGPKYTNYLPITEDRRTAYTYLGGLGPYYGGSRDAKLFSSANGYKTLVEDTVSYYTQMWDRILSVGGGRG